MWDNISAEEADRMQHLVMLRRADCAQQNGFLDPKGLVKFEKPDAFFGCADAEFCALFAHLLGCRLAGMRPAREPLVARIIAAVIDRYRGGIVVTPHQPGALTLLLDVPGDELGAASGRDPRVLV